MYLKSSKTDQILMVIGMIWDDTILFLSGFFSVALFIYFLNVKNSQTRRRAYRRERCVLKAETSSKNLFLLASSSCTIYTMYGLDKLYYRFLPVQRSSRTKSVASRPCHGRCVTAVAKS